ncbi:MAG: CrcB family protein [Eggerthellales bacterium]|nr:CrcB family protein [Eggerthellales bacterium]
MLGSQAFVYGAIMVAGFCGACLRYACELLPLPYHGGFPVNTLLINVVGSYLIFLVFQQVGHRLRMTPQVVKIINTGFLGAFTTLATFCTENVQLLVAGEYLISALYMFLTFALSFGAVLLAVKTCDLLALRKLKKLQRQRAERAQRRREREARREGFAAGSAEMAQWESEGSREGNDQREEAGR